jgi:hypothetical protein
VRLAACEDEPGRHAVAYEPVLRSVQGHNLEQGTQRAVYAMHVLAFHRGKLAPLEVTSQ